MQIIDVSLASSIDHIYEQTKLLDPSSFEHRITTTILRLDDAYRQGYIEVGVEYFISRYTNPCQAPTAIPFAKKKFKTQDALSINYLPTEKKQSIILAFNRSTNPLKHTAQDEVFGESVNESFIITSSDVGHEVFFPENTELDALWIYLPVASLRDVFLSVDTSIEKLLAEDVKVYEYRIMPPQMRAALEAVVNGSLATFYDTLTLQKNMAVLIELAMQSLPANQLNPSKFGLNSKDIAALITAENRLISNMKTPPSIASLAREAAMSQSKFKKIFKLFFGKSVYQYYLFHKLVLASHMLEESSLTISEIAHSLGYVNVSHFSSLFEKHFGVLPNSYKKSQAFNQLNT